MPTTPAIYSNMACPDCGTLTLVHDPISLGLNCATCNKFYSLQSMMMAQTNATASVSAHAGPQNAATPNLQMCPFCSSYLAHAVSPTRGYCSACSNYFNVTGNTVPHTWDNGCPLAVCSVCLIDAYNQQSLAPCPGSPTNWPAHGYTSYPDCSCQGNQWTVLSNGTFECGLCLTVFTLAGLQAQANALQTAPPAPPGAAGISHPFSNPFLASGYWAGSPKQDELDFGVLVEKEPAPPLCVVCTRELSSEMDAYWGKDPWEAKKCAPCRLGRPF